MTRKRMQALRYPNDEVEVVTELVNLHLRFHTYRLGWTDRAVRRYVRDTGPLLDRLNELTRCDCTTRNANKARALGRRMDELEARIDELRQQEELEPSVPTSTGPRSWPNWASSPGARWVGRSPSSSSYGSRRGAGRGGSPQAPQSMVVAAGLTPDRSILGPDGPASRQRTTRPCRRPRHRGTGRAATS